MNTRIYKLTPVAAEWDPNWDLAENQGEVIVRAQSPADARVVASEAEPDFLDSGGKPAEGSSTRDASAFRDEKLYAVAEIDSSGFPAEGPRELLAGSIANPLKTGQST
ncbi:hypothetical protein [Roseibium marinum]|uniref:Uncharacterized protein n=1 Tax=Roseibium marinum TaxID=281252 RepID=A0A2S3UP12_9HYPH|nr:hypothetical protein [Roseibium marinum]POF29414.1 hypothetical protein CLV41_109190 [Roseibium marinum]